MRNHIFAGGHFVYANFALLANFLSFKFFFTLIELPNLLIWYAIICYFVHFTSQNIIESGKNMKNGIFLWNSGHFEYINNFILPKMHHSCLYCAPWPKKYGFCYKNPISKMRMSRYMSNCKFADFAAAILKNGQNGESIPGYLVLTSWF